VQFFFPGFHPFFSMAGFKHRYSRIQPPGSNPQTVEIFDIAWA
jgi:hypothetical protein